MTIERIEKRGSGVKGRNILESGKSRLQPSMSSIPMSQRKKRRGVTLVRLCNSTMIRRATLLVTAPSQKTSVDLGNLHTSN